MPDRPLKLSKLIRILKRYGISWDPSRGKGSHGSFVKLLSDGRELVYPVPTHDKDVLWCYVRGARKRFKLTPLDGITDRDFYHG